MCVEHICVCILAVSLPSSKELWIHSPWVWSSWAENKVPFPCMSRSFVQLLQDLHFQWIAAPSPHLNLPTATNWWIQEYFKNLRDNRIKKQIYFGANFFLPFYFKVVLYLQGNCEIVMQRDPVHPSPYFPYYHLKLVSLSQWMWLDLKSMHGFSIMHVLCSFLKCPFIYGMDRWFFSVTYCITFTMCWSFEVDV